VISQWVHSRERYLKSVDERVRCVGRGAPILQVDRVEDQSSTLFHHPRHEYVSHISLPFHTTTPLSTSSSGLGTEVTWLEVENVDEAETEKDNAEEAPPVVDVDDDDDSDKLWPTPIPFDMPRATSVSSDIENMDVILPQ